MLMKLSVAAISAMVLGSGAMAATMSTTASPTSAGELPGGVSSVGGLVLDLIGLNGTRVVSQLAASSLFVGFNDLNPQGIGTQTGFDAGILSAFGGGLSELSVRVTLFDGDSAAGDFDDNDTELLLNGTSVGNFSDVTTQSTDALGAAVGQTALGFADGALDTGFFYTTDGTALSSIFTSMQSTGNVVFAVNDVDPGDNFLDFTQGIDSSLINVGTGPIVTTPSAVPLPAGIPLILTALGSLGYLRRRRRAA